MSTHTPGPWRFALDFGEVQSDDGGTLIAYTATDTSSRFDGSTLDVPDWDTMEANGRILAAAPAMYEAITARLAAHARSIRKAGGKGGCHDEFCETFRPIVAGVTADASVAPIAI